MKTKIAELIAQQVEGMSSEDISSFIEIPPRSEMGDFAFPCFRLAKTLHKAPNIIAAEIKDAIGPEAFIDKIQVQGAYLNFYINREIYAKTMIDAALSDNFGGSDKGADKVICIDYSSPNVAKNFHVGHLRTTIIGNSLYKIYSKLGYKVIRINHLGDWGTQFGKLIVAYKAWGSKEAVEQNGVAELMNLYVKFHDEANDNPELMDEARAWFNKMEQGDEEALSIWQWFKDISLVEYKRTYDLLGMDFDYYLGESFYRDKCQDVVDKVTSAGLLKESEGAMIVDLSEYDMAPCIVTKKDGSSIYATRDLAAIFYRKSTYNFIKCLYVTGQEQKLHFAQVFKVVELLGNEWAKEQLIHIPYGLVSLEGAKLSTRSGNIIYAEDILHEAIDKSLEIIKEKSPNLPDKEAVAKIVGVGSVLFNDLYNQRIKDVSFSWDKVLNFDGETGPYVQYTHARCSSVVRLAEDFDPTMPIDYSVATDADAMDLLKTISRFPKAISDAADKYEPSIVARFAVDVAQAFNKFYNSTRINVPEKNIKNTRVMLTYLTKKTIKDALNLLGIDAPDAM